MTSISFYLGNRRRVFAHPCYKMQGEQTEDHGDQTKKYVRRFAPNFLQMCLPTLASNRAGAPAPCPNVESRVLYDSITSPAKPLDNFLQA